MLEWLLTPEGVAVVLALVAAGAIQGSTGFGFSMLAAPVLAVADPAFVPGPMIAMAIVVSLGGMVRERREVNLSDLKFALAGRLVAAGLAAAAIGALSDASFSAIFGLAVLLAVALSLLGARVERTPASLFAAGTVSGFMGTLTSIGAPPMALVYQNAGGARMRATLNAFFVVGGLISIVALLAVGRFGAADIVLAAGVLPFALAGFLLSGTGRRLVDKGRVKLVVLTVSTISAAILLARAFA